jgi:hypothetical protein
MIDWDGEENSCHLEVFLVQHLPRLGRSDGGRRQQVLRKVIARDESKRKERLGDEFVFRTQNACFFPHASKRRL